MPTLRNVNPIGQADVPLIGRQGDNGEYAEEDSRGYAERTPVPGTGCLEVREEFQCSAEHARLLLAQPGNYEPVDAEAQQIAEQLRAEAEQPAAGPEPDPEPDAPPATAVDAPADAETAVQ